MPIDKVFVPGPNKVFVFGSNTAGIHGGGAARTAFQQYGAIWGQGEGHHGASYALPTKDSHLQTLPLNVVEMHVKIFLAYARLHPELSFFVTRVGCGLAGYTDADIAPLFKDAPGNCDLPHGW